MIGEFVVGVAMLGTEHAARARVASRRAVGLDFDSMGQAFRDVPSGFEAHRAGGAGGNACARGALRARVEALSDARLIEFFVEQ